MMVMMMAITPSLNASSRPLVMSRARAAARAWRSQRRSQPLEPVERPLVADVPRVERRRRLEQQHLRLALGHGPVLDAARDDEELPRLEAHVPVAELHAELARHDEEHLVLEIVVVPHELALEPDELHHLAVELAHDLGDPVLVDTRECLGEIDSFQRHRKPPLTARLRSRADTRRVRVLRRGPKAPAGSVDAMQPSAHRAPACDSPTCSLRDAAAWRPSSSST